MHEDSACKRESNQTTEQFVELASYPVFPPFLPPRPLPHPPTHSSHRMSGTAAAGARSHERVCCQDSRIALMGADGYAACVHTRDQQCIARARAFCMCGVGLCVCWWGEREGRETGVSLGPVFPFLLPSAS